MHIFVTARNETRDEPQHLVREQFALVLWSSAETSIPECRAQLCIAAKATDCCRKVLGIAGLEHQADALVRHNCSGLTGHAMQHRYAHSHALEQLRRNDALEQLALAQMNHGGIEKRPVPRHLVLGDGIEEQHVVEAAITSGGDESLLTGAIAEEHETVVISVRSTFDLLCRVEH